MILNGEIINNLRYKDGTELLSYKQKGLKTILDGIVEKCTEVGLRLNSKVTKLFVLSKQQNVSAGVYVDYIKLEEINQIGYLECLIN